MVQTMRQEARRLLSDVPGDNVFRVNDGCILHNLKELGEELRVMSDDTYVYHANEQKNDFINWVKDIIRDETLARELQKSSSKAQAARAVSNRTSILAKRLA